MLQTKNYRSSTENREILRILQQSENGLDNFLWQSKENSKFIVPILRMEIDFVAREVVLLFDPKHSIHEDLPIFIKLDYKESVFKVTDFSVKKNMINFTFPGLIKTLEQRSSERFSFEFNSEKQIGLFAPSEIRDSGQEFNVRVVDVSTTGLGVIITESDLSYVKNNPRLLVTRLGINDLDEPLLVEVVYINSEVPQNLRNRKAQELKVGMKFLNEIQEEHLNQFLF